jgi:hypothetical protein
MSSAVKDQFKYASGIPQGPYCVCNGPPPGDAQFVIAWLTEVLAVDIRLKMFFLEHPEFRSRIEPLEADSLVEFRAPAMVMISKWLKRVDAFCVDLSAWYGELFAVMATVGFFELEGTHYKMTIPPRFEIDVLATVLLRLAETEDSDFCLHPERLVHTMSVLDAKRVRQAVARSNKAIRQSWRDNFTP